MDSELTRQLLLERAATWITVAYIACMFLVAGFRSENIGNAALFRTSFVLFAMYIIVPAVMNGIFTISMLEAGNRVRSGNTRVITQIAVYIIGQLLLAGSIVCGLASLRLGRRAAVPRRDLDRFD